jgi:uncharacterized protein YbjT (DUF2867 family)
MVGVRLAGSPREGGQRGRERPARDPGKAADLAAQGIEVRTGDYLDRSSLTRAFAGVGHLVYTPIIRKAGSDLVLPQVTEPDAFTLERLAAADLETTILGHPLCLEGLLSFIGDNPSAPGVRVPAGHGKVAAATREDRAEAQAVVLTEPGHEGKTYALHGDPAVSLSDLAEILSDWDPRRVPGRPAGHRAVAVTRHRSAALSGGRDRGGGRGPGRRGGGCARGPGWQPAGRRDRRAAPPGELP